MSYTRPAKMSACSFNIHPRMLSGPFSLHGFNFDSFLRTDSTDKTREFSEQLLKVVHGKAAGSGVKQCIGDKKASLMMLARPIWSIPSCRCCSDFKGSLCAVEATERPRWARWFTFLQIFGLVIICAAHLSLAINAISQLTKHLVVTTR